MNWRREWSILHMVDKLLVLLPRQCWAVYSGEATVRKIAVCARASSALCRIGIAASRYRDGIDRAQNLAPQSRRHLAPQKQQIHAIKQCIRVVGQRCLRNKSHIKVVIVTVSTRHGGLHAVEVADYGGYVGDLHLRRGKPRRLNGGAGGYITRSKPVEDAGRARSHLGEAVGRIFGAADVESAAARFPVKARAMWVKRSSGSCTLP